MPEWPVRRSFSCVAVCVAAWVVGIASIHLAASADSAGWAKRPPVGL